MFATPSIVAWFWNSEYGRTFCLLAIAVCGIYARAVYMKEVDFVLSESLRFFFFPPVCVFCSGWNWLCCADGRTCLAQLRSRMFVNCMRALRWEGRANISFARVVPFKFPHHF